MYIVLKWAILELIVPFMIGIRVFIHCSHVACHWDSVSSLTALQHADWRSRESNRWPCDWWTTRWASWATAAFYRAVSSEWNLILTILKLSSETDIVVKVQFVECKSICWLTEGINLHHSSLHLGMWTEQETGISLVMPWKAWRPQNLQSETKKFPHFPVRLTAACPLDYFTA